MTILVCQKRHHEPHFVRDSLFWVFCDGLPRWPYTRPKPPRDALWSAEYGEYQKAHKTIAIYQNDDCGWTLDSYSCNPNWGRYEYEEMYFPTHAEAITYAQALVNERRAQDGADQGA